jgi:hypothetical protein
MVICEVETFASPAFAPNRLPRSLAMLDELRSIFKPEIRVDAPQVVVNVPPQPAPQVVVNVPAPEVTVNVPETPVQLKLDMMMPEHKEPPKTVTVKRNPSTGLIESATVKETY